MQRDRVRRKLAALTLLAMSGSTVFSVCQARVRDAFVSGTKTFITTDLLQDLFEGLLPDTGQDDGLGGDNPLGP